MRAMAARPTSGAWAALLLKWRLVRHAMPCHAMPCHAPSLPSAARLVFAVLAAAARAFAAGFAHCGLCAGLGKPPWSDMDNHLAVLYKIARASPHPVAQ